MKHLLATGLAAMGTLGPLAAVDYYVEDFDSNDGGFSASGTNSSWQHGNPSLAPASAQSGSDCWATSLAGSYASDEDSYVVSPGIDLSSHAGGPLLMTWWQFVDTEANFDFASLEVTNDGGGSWDRVFGEVTGDHGTAWLRKFVVLDSAMAVSNFRFRFRMRSDASTEKSGIAVDSIRIFSRTITQVYDEDFEADGGGFVSSGTNDSWEWGSAAAETGSAWATGLDAFYQTNEDSRLTSPAIDLSGLSDTAVLVTWKQQLSTEAGFDFGMLEAKKADGSWVGVDDPMSGLVSDGWMNRAVLLGPEFSSASFQLRFGMDADEFFENTGFSIDDVVVSSLSGGGTPIVTWSDPASIDRTVPLSGVQLNAIANLPGWFDYHPGVGSFLPAGNAQELQALFIPDDLLMYDPVLATVHIDVTGNSINYDSWAAGLPGGNPGLLLREADFDADGSSNFLEYGLVTDGASSDPTGAPEWVHVDVLASTYQAIEFSVRSNDPLLSYRFQVSTGLQAWSSSSLSFNGAQWSLAAGNGVLVSAVEIDPDVWRLTVRELQPLGATDRTFMRVEVIEP